MKSAIVVLNAGSSSVKYALYGREPGQESGAWSANPLCRGAVPGVDSPAQALQPIWLRVEHALEGRAIIAVGHRIVHGGTRFMGPVAITAEVERQLHDLVPLAPLHQPQGLALIEPLRRLAPDAQQVACFDTSFHRTQPEIAQIFALPGDLTASGIRSYGFHGLSYEFIASRLPQLLAGRPFDRVIVAHLGNGSSLCALRDLKSAGTTMTFTPLDGLPMATRCGSLDPAVVLYLASERGLVTAEISDLLNKRSGLLGVSGVSGDVQTLMASPNAQAKRALDLLVYRTGREIGSMAAILGGLDALVFTGGIGEHAAVLRAAICEAAAWLGIELDARRNAAHGPLLTADHSRASAWMIPTDEESVIARHTQTVIDGAQRQESLGVERSDI
jgi:acetate kinase